MGSKIYVGGLPYSATEQQLRFVRGAWGGGIRPDHHGQVYRPIERFLDLLRWPLLTRHRRRFRLKRLGHGWPDIDGQ